MNAILLSIYPKYVEKIFSGAKKYEYRKRACPRNIDKIFIYETAPTSMVVGEAQVIQIIKDTPENIWNKTHKEGGIDLEDFNKYFENKEYAYAYQLGEVIKYEKSKTLSDFGLKTPPQSFVYV